MSDAMERNARTGAFEILFGATEHRRVLSRVFAAAALQAAIIGLLSVAIGHPDHRALLAGCSVLTIAFGMVLLIFDISVTFRASIVIAVFAGGLLVAACYAQGPSSAAILVSFVVAAAALMCSLYTRRDALWFLLVVFGWEVVFFFWAVPHVPDRFVIFAWSISLAIVVAALTTFIVTKIQRLAESEQAARAAAEQAHNDAEAARAALEAANRHKSAFLANMSHELRTPLNAVIGFSDVLDERLFGGLNEKQAEYVADIRSSGEHLLSLVNDILDLSKVEAGHMELDISDVSVAALATSIASLFREEAARTRISLDTRVAEGVGVVHADERKVRQILVNLVANAMRFTPEGGSVSLSAVRSNGHVVLSVTDTGPGIVPEKHESIFEEFAQLGTNARGPGTGLGLALARRFTELHGGRLTVQSEPGRGATFLISLPTSGPITTAGTASA
ncbi:MAG: HAMP domain-containing histidine kinase [Mycobacterium sp.]|nr:HAMP domain-containing histidine kinase [Mycobacterium sp.]